MAIIPIHNLLHRDRDLWSYITQLVSQRKKTKHKNLKVNIPVIYLDTQTAQHPSDIKGFYLQLSLTVPESDRKPVPSVPSLGPVPILPHFKNRKKERT